MATYNFTISEHFSGSKPNLQQLHNFIENDDGINVTFYGIEIRGDNVYLFFESTLPTIEDERLNTIISDYVADFSKPKKLFYTISPKKDMRSTTIYSKVTSFNFAGSKVAGLIDYIELISYMDDGLVSYDARIFDKQNNKVIAEKIFINNTDEDIIDLGPISNVPEEQTIMELHVKVNGTGKDLYVHIDAINIYHGN